LASDYLQQHFAALDVEKYDKQDERVYDTLAKLKEIVPISVFTNAKPDRLQRTLKVIQVDPAWFTHTLTGDDVAQRKPALEGFHKMIELTGLPADQLLYVGDRVSADIIPAKQVGMKAALVWSADNEADYCFNSFDEILRLFNK